jgi:hypothetical protein
MQEIETITTTEAPRPRNKVTVKVNDHHVTLLGKDQTGATIKAAAIAQAVPIQPDFDLSEVLPNGKQKPISNDKEVEVKNGDEFWAIPGDDNS